MSTPFAIQTVIATVRGFDIRESEGLWRLDDIYTASPVFGERFHPTSYLRTPRAEFLKSYLEGIRAPGLFYGRVAVACDEAGYTFAHKEIALDYAAWLSADLYQTLRQRLRQRAAFLEGIAG